AGRAAGGNTYVIHNHVAPGAHPAEVGRATVEAIRQFEKRSGKSWRSLAPGEPGPVREGRAGATGSRCPRTSARRGGPGNWRPPTRTSSPTPAARGPAAAAAQATAASGP